MIVVTAVLVFAVNVHCIAGQITPKIDLVNTTFSKTEGYKLTNYVSESSNVPSAKDCVLRCLSRWPTCKSLNYQPNAASDQNNCVLNNKMKAQVANNFVADSSWTYYENDNIMNIKSCLDYRRLGYTRDGVYFVMVGTYYLKVFCDFNSESNSAWTLILSFALRHRNEVNFCSKPLTVSRSSNKYEPHWDLYRLSFDLMEALSQQSTHIRITTNFDKYGLSYRDYLRAKIADLNILTYTGDGVCKTVERINIRGIERTNIGVPFWQLSSAIFHTDSYHSAFKGCGYDATSGAVENENNFGLYCAPHFNSNFKGSENDDSTTNYWFGGYL